MWIPIATARATSNPIGSGATKLTLAKSFLGLLKQNGVKLSAVAPATLKAGTLTLPVASGQFDPVAAKGNVEALGALRFKAGPHSVPLTSWTLKSTQRHAPLSVKVGGGQLKLATLAKLTVTRAGFGDTVTTANLKLSAKVAERLGRKLRLPGVFAAGQLLGSATTSAEPTTVAIASSGAVDFSFDPGIAAKLQSLFVAVNPVFPAEHPGPFTLPIFAGALAPDLSSGALQTQGSLELIQIGGGQVFWREPAIDFALKTFTPEVEVDPAPPYAGKLGPSPIASSALTSVLAEPKARTIAVSASLGLSATAAASLNEAFAKPLGKQGVFLAGETLGTISFTAQAQ